MLLVHIYSEQMRACVISVLEDLGPNYRYPILLFNSLADFPRAFIASPVVDLESEQRERAGGGMH